MMKRFGRWAAAGLVCAVCVGAGAQDEASAPTLQVKARLVVLDVTVTDAKGKPIDGLTKDDFEVFEDGKVQQIRSVEPPSAHVLPATTATGANAAGEVFDPAQPANFGRAPVTILVLDQLNTHFADSSFARGELKKYLDKQSDVLATPTTLVMVAEGRFRVLAEFTRDRAKLQAALAKAPTVYSWKLESSGSADYSPLERLDGSLRSLEEMANSYARIPGRKNVVWIGGGFPSIDPGTLAPVDYSTVENDIKHVTDVLLNSRVTLYAVDPSSTVAGMAEITDFQTMAAAQLAGNLTTRTSGSVDSDADFDALATSSGGRSIRSMNNVAQQIALSVDYGSTFYTISYSPTSESEAAQTLRRIKVVCTKPGVVATTRTGYYVGQTQATTDPDRIAYDLSTAADSPLPLRALRVRAKAAATTSEEDEGGSWQIEVAAPDLTWVHKENGESEAKVEILAASISKQGKMVGHVLHSASAVAAASANLGDPNKMASFEFPVSPAPKTSMIRFVVRDAATGHMGSFDVEVK